MATQLAEAHLPTHDPALWRALGGGDVGLDAEVASIQARLAAGERVVLRHEVSEATLRDLPDLVRFVDDHLREVAGIRFAGGPVPAGLMAWWRSALGVCASREVAWELAAGCRLPEETAPGLRTRREPALQVVVPEDIAVLARPESGDWLETVQEMLAWLGGIARFVHPAASLVPADLAAPYVRPRPELTGLPEVPRVRVVSCADPPDGLTESVRQSIGSVGATVVGGAESGDLDVAVIALATGPPLVGASSCGVDARLFVVDAPQLGVVAAGGCALALDRFFADGLGQDPEDVPDLAGPAAAKVPWARHEGIAPAGAVPERCLTGPPRLPRRRAGKPLTILGIASTTLQNHGAALLRDGQIVASVQEERLRRRKQLGWHLPGRPFDTVVSHHTIPVEWAYPRRAIASVLAQAGIGWDDVDCIALNGIPGHYLTTYSTSDPRRPPRTLKVGRTMCIPHHLAHAASAYRVGGLADAFVFTVDGRGERETAAFFEPTDTGELVRVFDILCGEDTLIGGVYEYFTTILGFGHHGQGSTMGLAPLGTPAFDVAPWLSVDDRRRHHIHDRGIEAAWGHLARERDGLLERAHMDLAASVQSALERAVETLIRDGLGGRPCRSLALAGGVALNCAMNQRLRLALGVEEMFVQPAAHDAGTALGAALEAHWNITGEAIPTVMNHAFWGPSYSNEAVATALQRFGLQAERRADIPGDVAELVAAGDVVCWFQGRMELGPRALGARSIVSDPRRVELKERINVMKGRQWWRPFGPSILAGAEADWFETPFETPFMLFTLPVREDRRDQIPACVHVDGTSRPQSVRAEAHPRYHAMISRFHALTGVPMVVNTSFNTAFEPIVASPEDAISSWLQLGADWLAIEDWLVRRAS